MRSLGLLLGGQVERLDLPGSLSGIHDFDVVVEDGRRIAVEVTACIDKAAAQFESALDSHSTHIDVPGLRRSWEVRLHEGVRVKGLIKRVAPLLVTLENEGVSGVFRRWSPDNEPMVLHEGALGADERKAAQALIDLGADTAWAFDRSDGHSSVEFIRRSGSSSANSEPLVTAEVACAAENKRTALSRPSALRRAARHLFVWLDSDYCGRTHFALWSGQPAAAPPPALPSPIDHGWVAGWSMTPGQGIGYVVIWEAARGGRWRYPSALSGNDAGHHID